MTAMCDFPASNALACIVLNNNSACIPPTSRAHGQSVLSAECCGTGLQMIPIGAVQALVNVQLLSKIPPFKQLLQISFTNAIIVSILPGAGTRVGL